MKVRERVVRFRVFAAGAMVAAAGLTLSGAVVSESPERAAIRSWFEQNAYGVRPESLDSAHVTFAAIGADKTMMGGAAIRKRVRITYSGPYGTNGFDVVAFLPAKAAKPVPAFLLICNRDPAANIDPERVNTSAFWPAEEIVARGYAAIAFWNGDLAVDWNDGNQKGVFACFEPGGRRSSAAWGTLSAWAWGASRVMDWIETEPALDARHVAVVGHSRGGKTALLAGVSDPRFAMACVNCSGCSGAKLNKMDLPWSEHIAQICVNFPYWFCSNYIKWANRENDMPYDQDAWMTLMAPRLVAVGSAEEDHWAGQDGERVCCEKARRAWQDPTSVDYHRRPGSHDLTRVDWNAYMDFADRKNWRR